MAAVIALKAFAANIIGGYGSIPGAILGGLALGVVETLGAAYISVPYKDAFAFLMLLVFLHAAAAGAVRRTDRGKGMSGTVPHRAGAHGRAPVARPAGHHRGCIVVMGLASLAPDQGYILNILMQAATYAIAVVGLVVVLGYCGQISIAQAAFFGLGAYGVALGTVDFGLNFFLALALGVRRLGVRPDPRARQPAPRRSLPRHGDDQLPADPHRRAHQLDRLHPRARRRPQHPAPGRAASASRLAASISASAWSSWSASPSRLAAPNPAASAAPCRRCATTNSPPAPAASTSTAPRCCVRHQRRPRRARRRPVRRRLPLHQPGPVQLRRIHRHADHGAARRRRNRRSAR